MHTFLNVQPVRFNAISLILQLREMTNAPVMLPFHHLQYWAAGWWQQHLWTFAGFCQLKEGEMEVISQQNPSRLSRRL